MDGKNAVHHVGMVHYLKVTSKSGWSAPIVK
jgi:hypothetical protein